MKNKLLLFLFISIGLLKTAYCQIAIKARYMQGSAANNI